MQVKIVNNTITLEPSLAEARCFWYNSLHSQVDMICSLNRIKGSRYYDQIKDTGRKTVKDYHSVLTLMNQDILDGSYLTLEGQMDLVTEYTNTWKQYQALWDLQSDKVYEQLGDNIEKWNNILNEINAGRKTFETSESEKVFGSIVVFFGGVQDKVANKYDTWHKEVLNKFSLRLAESLKNFRGKVSEARHKLETLKVDSEDVTMFVTEIQEMKKNVHGWSREHDKHRSGQKLLTVQRFQYPGDWLSVEQVDGEWNTFNQILGK